MEDINHVEVNDFTENIAAHEVADPRIEVVEQRLERRQKRARFMGKVGLTSIGVVAADCLAVAATSPNTVTKVAGVVSTLTGAIASIDWAFSRNYVTLYKNALADIAYED